ncbi:Cdk-activating kinase assembly factor MAT1, centre [Sesbania bispinosa]|nr:Cdk-activating kinase assembly factor MAT1, centre [Sesbania bispinosa]
MAFDLVEGIDVAAIEAKIAKYQEENAEQIMINRAQKAKELAAALAASKGQPAQTDNDVVSNYYYYFGTVMDITTSSVSYVMRVVAWMHRD